MMESMILFLLGMVYAYAGMFLTAIVGDMRGSRMHQFVDQFIHRGLLVLVLWPFALPVFAGHAIYSAKRSKQVLL